jgi:squalene-associated FAD-dependent desaturase
MKLAVVGAGWAGLAAAVDLKAYGHDVSVFEAAHTPGGRARRVARLSWGTALDNGQHILLGAYTETLALMRQLDRDVDRMLWRLPLQWGAFDGAIALRAPRWPAPLHALWALLTARGLSLADRWAAARLMLHVRQMTADAVPSHMTVAAWLTGLNQPASLITALWSPLCLAALNTPIDIASAQLYARVLHDSLTTTRAASDLLLPRTDLSSVWPDAAARQVRMRYGSTVRTLHWGEETIVLNSEEFDAAVLAIPPPAVVRLLKPYVCTPAAADLLKQLQAFTYMPIATLVLGLARPYRLPMPMMMLREDAGRCHDGQWVFDRTRMLDQNNGGELAIVVSAARALIERDRDQTIMQLIEQLREQAPPYAPLPAIIASELFIEKRATLAAVPGLARPSNHTPWPRLTLAGDWTDTGYPGVLEGAVRSGRQAARLFKVRAG